jgi:deoxyribodipyrimidine photo-lyase
VVWFRRDLRLADHPALATAVERGEDVVPVFVLDPALLAGRHARREAWVLAAVAALDGEMRGAGAPLVVRRGDPREEIPRLAREVAAGAVSWNRDYTPLARRRDAAVAAACRAIGVEPRELADAVIAEPDALLTHAGEPYRVFTPYHRAWAARPAAAPLPAPGRLTTIAAPPTVALPAIDRGDVPAAGPGAAAHALSRFLDTRVATYHERRDRLDVAPTSELSVHLRVGALSVRQVAAAAEQVAREARRRAGATAFLRQLAWREFFVQLLWHRPDTRHADLRPREIAWRDDPDGLAAWQEGRTGYPLVDAGMRQLARTGWMPNRARLVVASFLTRHLLVDWRAGERWFMRELLDGDPAVNVGNWQWVASTGADAMPGFRVFNPVLQGRRFDPGGRYVTRWVPELAGLPPERVHEPWVGGGVAGYGPPIVDHARARARALAVLDPTRGSGASARGGAGPGRPGRPGRRGGGGARGGGSA